MLKWWQLCPVAEAVLLPSSGYDSLHAVRSHRFYHGDTPIMLGTKERNGFLLLNTSQHVIVRTDDFLFV